jgi:hypothetical protein
VSGLTWESVELLQMYGIALWLNNANGLMSFFVKIIVSFFTTADMRDD